MTASVKRLCAMGRCFIALSDPFPCLAALSGENLIYPAAGYADNRGDLGGGRSLLGEVDD